MSTRAAANIQDEMEALGIRLTEVQNAQKRIIAVARKMSDEGSIVLAGRGGEKWYKNEQFGRGICNARQRKSCPNAGAIKTAQVQISKLKSPKTQLQCGFFKKSIEFCARKNRPSLISKVGGTFFQNARPTAEADHSSHDVSSEAPQNSEPTAAPQSGEDSDLDDLAQVLAERALSPPDIEFNQETTEQPVNPQATVDDQQSELYDEGSPPVAQLLSELEEQRLEHLGVLKSISEKLLTDSVYDFDNISKKVLDTVNELSSERCGLAIDENPERFLKRIAAQIEQVRNLSEERSVFFNEEDLAALKSFEEFESYFAKAKVRSDPVLKREMVKSAGSNYVMPHSPIMHRIFRMNDLTGELMRDLDQRLRPQMGSRVSGKVVKFDGLTAHCDGFPARVGAIVKFWNDRSTG